jgi:hypothetical protein
VELEPRGKADGAQHAQLVFGVAQFGVADGTDDSKSEVSASAHEIQHSSIEVTVGVVGDRVEQQAVDGEVAALDIFARVGGKTNCVGASTVRVGTVVAKGGDFGGDVGCVGLRGANEDYAEVGSDGECLREKCDDLVGGGRGGDVVIFRRQAEQEVTDAATGKESLVASLAQGACDGQRGKILWVGRAAQVYPPPPLKRLKS